MKNTATEQKRDKLVIFRECGEYKITIESNYNARIRNERRVTRLTEFNNPKEIIWYYNKFFGTTDSDFIVVE